MKNNGSRLSESMRAATFFACSLILAACGGPGGGEGSGAPFPIHPAKLSSDKVDYKLPHVIDNVVVGGGGRFLIFHFKGEQKLGVFDVNEAKLTGSIPLSSDDITYTAGARKLFVVLRRAQVLERYDLASLELEKKAKLDVIDPDVRFIAMGSASDGPILAGGGVGDEGEMSFVDPKSFKALEVIFDIERSGSAGRDAERVMFGSARRDVIKHRRNSPKPSGAMSEHVIASAQGTVFGFASSLGVYYMLLDGDRATLHRINWPTETVALPSNDGGKLHVQDNVLTTGGRISTEMVGKFFLPATHGEESLAVTRSSGHFNIRWKLAVHNGSDPRPLLTLPTITVEEQESFPLRKILTYIPRANLLVKVGAARDQLELYKVDVSSSQEKSGIDYLFVESKPPAELVRGGDYNYQIKAKSKRGGLKFTLGSGPDGMQITPDGHLTWAVPKAIGNLEHVVVYVSDDSDQEIKYSFTVGSGEGDPPPPALRSIPELLAPELPGITPTEMTGERIEVSLPAPFDEFVHGGGGRYLILHHKALRKLSVFDVSAGKIVKSIPLPVDDILFAAGGESLLVFLREQMILQRWSLSSFERELTQTIDPPENPQWMVMGSASAGPVAIGGRGEVNNGSIQFLDPKTFSWIHYKPNSKHGHGRIPVGREGSTAVRASADGKLFTGWEGRSRCYALSIEGDRAVAYAAGNSGGYAVPSANGKRIFTGAGILSSMLELVEPPVRYRFDIPAVQGDFFLGVPEEDRSSGNPKPLPLSVHRIGDTRPLFSLSRVPALLRDGWQWDEGLDLDQRFVYIPDAQALITFPADRSKLVVHRVDSEKERPDR